MEKKRKVSRGPGFSVYRPTVGPSEILMEHSARHVLLLASLCRLSESLSTFFFAISPLDRGWGGCSETTSGRGVERFVILASL